MEEELWKTITGFEKYQISNNGKIKSLIGIHKVLKPAISNAGYLRTTLSKNNNRKNVSIHRVVAIEFLPNPKQKKYINHIDGNKLNNHVSNLEWCTAKENAIHAHLNGLVNTKHGKKHHLSIPVLQLDKISGKIISEFCNTKEAERLTGTNDGNISSACSGKRKTAGGYKWKYKFKKK